MNLWKANMLRKTFIATHSLLLLLLYHPCKALQAAAASAASHQPPTTKTTIPSYPSVPDLNEKSANETNAPEYLDFDDLLNADAFEDLEPELKSAMKRFQVHTQALVWADAVFKCWRDGGHLATPADASEAHLLSRILRFTASHADVIDADTTEAMHVGVWYYFTMNNLEVNAGVSFGYEGWQGAWFGRRMNFRMGAAILPNGRLIDEPRHQKLFYSCDMKPMKKIILDDGEGYVVVGNEEFAYKLHWSPLTWFDAFDVCEREGGGLAAPQSKEQAGNLTEWISSREDLTPQGKSRGFFFGLNDLAEEGRWTYPNENYPGKLNIKWLHGIPKGDRSKNCAVLLPSGMYVDTSCTKVKPFVCQKVHTSPPKEELKYQEVQGMGSYAYHTKRRTWWQALITCRSENASLAVPNSKEEAQLLSELHERFQPKKTDIHWFDSVYSCSIYVGVHDLDRDRIWRTIDGQKVHDSGFHDWNIINRNSSYVDNFLTSYEYNYYLCSVLKNGKYSFFSCDVTCPFVCKKPLP